MTRVSAFSRPPRRAAAAAVIAAVACGLPSALPAAASPRQGDGAAAASRTPGTAPAAPAAPAAGVQHVNDELADIELLRPLLPLSLTRKQVDALVAALKETSAIGADVRRQDEAATLALADEIAKARADALKGALIPASFDAKIAATAKASDQRLAEAKQKAIKKLLTTMDGTLTSSQKETVFEWEKQLLGGGYRVPAEYKSDPAKAPKDVVRALALVELIKYSFLTDRTLALLQQYRPADASPADASPAAAGTSRSAPSAPAAGTTP